MPTVIRPIDAKPEPDVPDGYYVIQMQDGLWDAATDDGRWAAVERATRAEAVAAAVEHSKQAAQS